MSSAISARSANRPPCATLSEFINISSKSGSAVRRRFNIDKPDIDISFRKHNRVYYNYSQLRAWFVDNGFIE